MSSFIRQGQKKRDKCAPPIPRLSAPRYNRWSCACGYSVLTVEHVEGVTPFLLPCDRCKTMSARSHMYKVALKPDEKPDGEWRQPSPAEYGKLNAACREHCDLGGLNYYPFAPSQSSEN